MLQARYVILFVLLSVLGSSLPAAAQSRGHGAIFYSSSGARIGWSKSLSSDDDARSAAQAMCQGGQIAPAYLQEFQEQEAGVSSTGSGPPLSAMLSDCREIIKFDSSANHQCGGFGFAANGNISPGQRARDRSGVQSALSNWPQSFIICNDDQAVSGIEKFATALSALANALSPNNQNQGLQPGQIGGTAVSFRNTSAALATFGLKCPNESSYHSFSVPSGTSLTVDASNWGMSCDTYAFLITTTGADGSTTSLAHQVQGGRSYDIAFNPQKGVLDLATGAPVGSGVRILNDTNITLTYTLMCPAKTPTTLTLDAGSARTTHINCDSGTLQVVSGTSSAEATYKSMPIQNGGTYHLRYDPNSQAIVIVAGP